ncbi:MAG TPA: hypothetical protein VGW80_00835 [Solirubrobacterales bacterium]|jgi:uncharacterized membrane protein YeaQ/YmgE (transglycosylase-associated protein family)|nr:hypothetical protein [Solirubrobacterales bacterium]
MEVIGYIILLALSGLVIGALARLLLIGPDPMSILETMLAGIGGSLIAGLIAYYVFDRNTGPGLLLSIVCAMAIVYAIRKYRQRAEPHRARSVGGPMSFGGNNVHTQVHFFPGCLVFSLLASVILTVLLNLIVRAF